MTELSGYLTDKTSADVIEKIRLSMLAWVLSDDRPSEAQELLLKTLDSLLSIEVRYSASGVNYTAKSFYPSGTISQNVSCSSVQVHMITLVSKSGHSELWFAGAGVPSFWQTGSPSTAMHREPLKVSDVLAFSTKDMLKLIELGRAKRLVAKEDMQKDQLKVVLAQAERSAWASMIKKEIIQLLKEVLPSKLFDDTKASNYAESWANAQLGKPDLALKPLQDNQLFGIIEGYKAHLSR